LFFHKIDGNPNPIYNDVKEVTSKGIVVLGDDGGKSHVSFTDGDVVQHGGEDPQAFEQHLVDDESDDDEDAGKSAGEDDDNAITSGSGPNNLHDRITFEDNKDQKDLDAVAAAIVEYEPYLFMESATSRNKILRILIIGMCTPVCKPLIFNSLFCFVLLCCYFLIIQDAKTSTFYYIWFQRSSAI
jgi:hypothetical protein